MTATDQPPAVALRRMTTAYWTSQVIYVAATLGIPDILANRPQTSEALAATTGTHAPSLYRLLRAVASLGILEEDEARRFSLTPLGTLLRSDVPGSMRAWAILLGEPWFRSAWDNLLHSIRTGNAAFENVHGAEFWAYVGRDPDANALFNTAITGVSLIKANATVEAYDFSEVGVVVDVGGGHGTLLAVILAGHPKIRGVLFDLPHVVEGASAVLGAAGVVADRCEIVGGSFFEAVPAGGDAYVLSSVIHDWDDESSVRILQTCRRSMGEGAKLLVVEQVVPIGNEYHSSKFDDINMLVLFRGRERTAEEFRRLLITGGFTLSRILPTSSQWSVLEAVPQ
jgi:O-methyltransferase domain/Dimerisation domain